MQTKVDQTALKFNQGSIITVLLLAFLMASPCVVAEVAAVMLVGTLAPNAGLFKQIYATVVKPRGWLKPNVIADDPQPHLFAQGVGALFLIASSAALFAGAAMVGWVLAAIVIVLAAVNLFLGFCAGCFVYFQLARAGVKVSLPSWQ